MTTTNPSADRTALAAIVRATATFVGDTYSGEWAADASSTLEADADRIERGEPCSLLRLAGLEVEPQTEPATDLAVLSSLANPPRPHAGHEWEPQPGMTPVHCPGVGDARRARYVQEIHAAGPLAVNGAGTIADAVMAVADEEITEALRVSDAATAVMLEERRNENIRLRAELEQARELLADRRETQRDHAKGQHEYCGPECEVEFPSDKLRNFILAKGYPGTAGALDELLRRAAAGRPLAETLASAATQAPPRHVGGRVNAEDCPACCIAPVPPPYPWICPGEPEPETGGEEL